MRLAPAIIGLVLCGMLLAACALDGFNPPPQGFDNPDAPNLAAMSEKIQTVFKAVSLAGYPRLSALRPAPVTALADWMVCLRNDLPTELRSYALFIQRNEVVDYRLALPIDQCAGDTYAPLPIAMPVK